MENDNVAKAPTTQDDGAGEKLVDEKNGHNSKGIEVKFISPSNGEAKIDIENMKSAFAGMGKEELMKFANDPFWVRTRWFLFIMFWVLWVAMLAGAIAIIVLAPKCAPPTPKEWWEQSPLYKADVATFAKDSSSGLKGDLKGFTTKLDYLSKLGVKTVVLSNILKVSDKESDGVDEFKTIAPSFGTVEDLKALISAAQNTGLKILLTLVPNHSSLKNPLFTKSASGDEQFSSYYVWADGKGNTRDGERIPPNNWLSKENGSAWEWNENKQKFYLHQFGNDEPELNFHNPDVVKYFQDIMEFWLKQGVAGFYIERAAYLVEDPELRNETESRVKSSATWTDYEFYSHERTSNIPELATLLRTWTSFVTNSSGILLVDDVTVAKKDRSIAHLVVEQQKLKPYPQFSVEDLRNVINTTLEARPWPTWQVKVEGEIEGSALSQGVMLFTMLLPGTPITVAGQELGLENLQQIPWDNTTDKNVKTVQENSHSIYNAYKDLVEARASPSILHGSLQLEVINGTSVLAYTRIKSGNPGYLVVFNSGSDENVEVNVRSLSSVPEQLTLLISSDASSMADKTKVASDAVQLPTRSVAVFRFVPKEKE